MNKIFIVEGIDKVGKTILCKRLSKEFGIKIHDRTDDTFDYSQLKLGDVYAEEAHLMSKLHHYNESIVFDRCHLSEYVFGEYYRNYDHIKNLQFFSFCDYMAKMAGATLIYVRPTDMNRSNKEHGSDQRKIAALFDVAFYGSIIEKKYETNYDDFDNLIKTLKENSK